MHNYRTKGQTRTVLQLIECVSVIQDIIFNQAMLPGNVLYRVRKQKGPFVMHILVAGVVTVMV
jgi:hypothetical protein